MKQGEIWNANLDPSRGSEQAGQRPVVIISGDLLNQYLKIVIACPLTSQVKNYKGNVVLEPDDRNGLKARSEILVFHVRSLSKDRLIKKIGSLSPQELETIKKGLNEILRY